MSVYSNGQVQRAEKMTVPPGFLHTIYDVISKRFTQLNKDYLLSIAEVLLSSACWKVYTVDNYSQLAPNIWIQIISPSGDGKTLPIDHFIIPVLEKLEKMLSTKDERYILHLSDYNKESLIKYFKEQKPKKDKNVTRLVLKYGLLSKDENTMYLEAANSKGYMKDIIAVESKIYDGKLNRKITIARGLEEVPKCFKANISATTPAIYVFMKVNAFIQGGWNRYDFIIGIPIKPEEVELLEESFFHGGNLEERQRFEEAYHDCVDELKKIIDGDPLRLILDDESNLLWRQFQREMKQKAVALPNKDLVRGYLQRQAEKALKRAMLYTISLHLHHLEHLKSEEFPDFDGNMKKERNLVIEGNTMKIAIENQRSFLDYYKQMLIERVSEVDSGLVFTNEAERNYFAMKCEKLAEKYGMFSRKLLIEATQWNSCDRRLTDNIESAKVERKLIEFSGDESRGICVKHKIENDMTWFEAQQISPSFKNPPYLFKWKGVDKN